MQFITGRKIITLSALIMSSILALSSSALAQETNSFTGDAGAIANRLNPVLPYSGSQQQPRLKKIMIKNLAGQNSNLVIDRGHRVNLFIPFAPGSAKLPSKAKKLLEEVGGALEELNESRRQFLVIGHTDATGTQQSNKRLSLRRAMAVRTYILKQFNINPHRLLAVGVGESDPYDRQKPNARKNRRIEVVLVADDRRDLSLSYNDRMKTQHQPSNAVCDSYQGVRLQDIRPQHMDMDYYGARTAVRCVTSMKRKQDRR